MATDWQDYAKHMLKVMQAAKGWENCSLSDDYIPKPENRPVTKFQKRGEGLGHGMWDLMFSRVEIAAVEVAEVEVTRVETNQ